MLLDVNERLFIISLNKLMKRKAISLCSLKDFQEEINLDKDFFLATVIKMEKKKTIEIGFKRRNTIARVQNWYSKYPDKNDYYLKITKEGLIQI